MEKKSLCHICLRVDRKTQVLEESLGNFLDDICEFSIEDHHAKYCSECEYQLRKCYKFKLKCVRAIKILKQWKKTTAVNRQPLVTLYELLPLKEIDSKTHKTVSKRPRASVENPNFVDVSKNEDINHENETSNSENIKRERKNPLVHELQIKLEKDENDSKTELNYEPHSTNCVSKEFVKNETKKTLKNDRSKVDNESVSDAGRLSDTSIHSDDVTDSDEDYEVDDDTSDDEVIVKPKRLQLENDTQIELTNTVTSDSELNAEYKKAVSDMKKIDGRKKKVFSKERLKQRLMIMFANCEEVKSSDGTVIERNVVFESFDNWFVNTMKHLWKLMKVSETKLTAQALNLLAKLQKRYENKYDNVFEVEYLNNKEEAMAELLKRKTYESYVISPFKCELCYQGFKFEKTFENHKKMHDPSAGDFVCDICQLRMKTKLALIIHNKMHKKVFKCKLCPLVTYYRKVMLNHSQQHEGIQYTCKICEGSFKSQSGLNSHLMRHKTQHACPFCARTFVSVHGLDVHRNLKHKGEVVPDVGVSCYMCNIKFVSSDVYEKHKRVSHDDSGIVRRKRKHNSGEIRPRKAGKVTCRVCPATGGSPMWLQTHMRAEHPEWQPDSPAHLCDVCGKGYPCKSILEQHRNVHTGNRPFACDKCPGKFHTAQTLRIHAQRHMPPRWPCKECGKRFLSSANLYTHMRIHIGDRRFKCDACPAAFLHRSALNAHVRGVHCQQRRVKKPQNQPKWTAGNLEYY